MYKLESHDGSSKPRRQRTNAMEGIAGPTVPPVSIHRFSRYLHICMWRTADSSSLISGISRSDSDAAPRRNFFTNGTAARSHCPVFDSGGLCRGDVWYACWNRSEVRLGRCPPRLSTERQRGSFALGETRALGSARVTRRLSGDRGGW